MITIKENDKRFYIKESNLNNAGLGLFASVDINEGEHLELVGVMVDKGSIEDQCTSYSNAYKFAADYGNSFTKHIIPMGYAAIVNHANDKKDQNVEIRYIKKRSEYVCVYYFIKSVKKDEEILGNYGEGWDKVLDWTNKVYSKNSGDNEQDDWFSFLDFGLYNLAKLKRLQGKQCRR